MHEAKSARFVVSFIVDATEAPRQRVDDDVRGDDLADRPMGLVLLLWVLATASNYDGFEHSWVRLAFNILQAAIKMQLLLDHRLQCRILRRWQEHLTVLLGVEFEHGLRSVRLLHARVKFESFYHFGTLAIVRLIVIEERCLWWLRRNH